MLRRAEPERPPGELQKYQLNFINNPVFTETCVGCYVLVSSCVHCSMNINHLLENIILFDLKKFSGLNTKPQAIAEVVEEYVETHKPKIERVGESIYQLVGLLEVVLDGSGDINSVTVCSGHKQRYIGTVREAARRVVDKCMNEMEDYTINR